MDGIRMPDSNNEINEHLLGAQKVNFRDRILLSPYVKFLLPALLIAFFVPIGVYAWMISPYVLDSSYSTTTCNLKTEYYVDCLPGKIPTESECTSALCCWSNTLNICYHTVPSRHGYKPYGGVYSAGAGLTPRETNSPLGSANVRQIYLEIIAADSNHVEITISTKSQVSNRKRRGSNSLLYHTYSDTDTDLGDEDEVTQRLLYFLPRDRRRRTVEIELDGSSNLNAYVHYPEFSVTVARNDFTIDEESSIFSTARGPLILTKNYWEWTFYLTNGTLYGLNDLEVNGTTNLIYNNENGTITPAFLAISPSGQGAAYYVDYKGPLEVQVLNVSNLVILRGMSFPDDIKVHVFAGPTPLEAVQQLTQALSSGSESPLSIPPTYNYGLHVCPNGNLSTVEEAFIELNETIQSLASLITPWDSHCIHERLVSVLNHDLTTDDLDYVNEAKTLLEKTGRTFSPHLSPMVLADEGTLHLELQNSNLLLTNDSDPYFGLYQETSVVYPDWENSSVKTIATGYFTDYLTNTGSPESLWLRDAWPKDELNSSSRSDVDFTVFDYVPETLEYAMNTHTVPYNLTKTSGASHYVTHNSYSEGFRALVRSLIPTVEFFGPPGEGGNTTWSGLRRSIRSAVGSGIVGQLPPPTYICGTDDFDASIHEELCIRWYQAAVTFPHILVLPDRLPGGIHLSTSASLTAARALRFKASLATYQHTVTAGFFERGSPVLAPTYLYYPDESVFTHTREQFMWGEAIMVGLVTLPGVSQVQIQLPGDISWRHLMGGSEVTPVINGTVPVTANLGQLITLIRPGHVVPIHKEIGETTTDTISRNVTLVVNLNCEEGDCLASGEIYYGSKSGEFLSIKVNSTYLLLDNIERVKIHACDNSTEQTTYIESVELLGSSSHQVNTELCNLSENNVAVSLA